MPRFTKKPLTVEAVRWNGQLENYKTIKQWTNGKASADFSKEHIPVKIRTPSGQVTVLLGDWVIKGVQGEVYPCKSEIFSETYNAERTMFDKIFESRKASLGFYGMIALLVVGGMAIYGLPVQLATTIATLIAGLCGVGVAGQAINDSMKKQNDD